MPSPPSLRFVLVCAAESGNIPAVHSRENEQTLPSGHILSPAKDNKPIPMVFPSRCFKLRGFRIVSSGKKKNARKPHNHTAFRRFSLRTGDKRDAELICPVRIDSAKSWCDGELSKDRKRQFEMEYRYINSLSCNLNAFSPLEYSIALPINSPFINCVCVLLCKGKLESIAFRFGET